MFCAWMKRRRKHKIDYIKTLADCKKLFDKDWQWRYAVVTYEDNIPLCLCQTYDDANKTVEDYWRYGYPISKIVDLMYWEDYENENRRNEELHRKNERNLQI